MNPNFSGVSRRPLFCQNHNSVLPIRHLYVDLLVRRLDQPVANVWYPTLREWKETLLVTRLMPLWPVTTMWSMLSSLHDESYSYPVYLFCISVYCARPGPTVIWRSRWLIWLNFSTRSSGSSGCLAPVRSGVVFLDLVCILLLDFMVSGVFFLLFLAICFLVGSRSASFDAV